MTAVEGSLHRPASWAVIASGLAVVGVAFGLSRYGYGLLLPQMRASLGLGLGTLGVIGAGPYASYLAASLAAPRLVARWGLRATVVLGGLAAAGGMLLCAAATGAVSLGVGITLAGASAALVWPPYIAAVETHLAVGRRPGAHGLINSGTAYGVAVAGPLSLLAGSSWRTAWIVFAGLAVAVTAFSWRSAPYARPPAPYAPAAGTTPTPPGNTSSPPWRSPCASRAQPAPQPGSASQHQTTATPGD